MNITHRGVPPNERIWDGICAICKSRAEVTEDELANVKEDPRDGLYAWVECPVCGAKPSDGYGGIFFTPRKAR